MPRTEPLAYFITFSCYGTWLHGDERGSRDQFHRVAGTTGITPNPALREWERSRLKNPPQYLNGARRRSVRATLHEVANYRGWTLHALNVRTNHVHVVVTAEGKPEPVMTTFKGYATRRLREAHLAGPNEEMWSEHGSTIYVWNENQLHEVCLYVRFGQGADLDPGGDARAP